MSLLSRADVIRLLKELGTQMESRGAHADLFIVGGAAMALAYNTRRATKDLDAVFEPKNVVYEAAGEVGQRNDLPSDWLNDAVKGFLPGDDPNASVLHDSPGISVRVASPSYLFVMKAASVRVGRDNDDLRQLYRICGFRSVDEALDCVEQFYAPHLLSPKTMFILQEILSNTP